MKCLKRIWDNDTNEKFGFYSLWDLLCCNLRGQNYISASFTEIGYQFFLGGRGREKPPPHPQQLESTFSTMHFSTLHVFHAAIF